MPRYDAICGAVHPSIAKSMVLAWAYKPDFIKRITTEILTLVLKYCQAVLDSSTQRCFMSCDIVGGCGITVPGLNISTSIL
jgi:hypothetical protein